MSHKCPADTPWVERFRDYCFSKKISKIDKSNDIGITAGSKGWSVRLTESLSKLGMCWSLLLVERDSIPNHVGTGRILDPDWIDLGIANQWKKQCLSSPGVKYENPMKIWSISPAWFIDVKNKCVVPAQGRGPFIALSYRWRETSLLWINADTGKAPEA